jgi:hypothetical protein
MCKQDVNAAPPPEFQRAFFMLRLHAAMVFLENLYALLGTLHRVNFAFSMEAA